jgi:hypothetical protein
VTVLISNYLLAVIQKAVMAICDARAPFLTSAFATHQRNQRVVLLAAGRAAIQMGPQAGDRSLSVSAGQLELDELVQPVEALVAADLSVARP